MFSMRKAAGFIAFFINKLFQLVSIAYAVIKYPANRLDPSSIVYEYIYLPPGLLGAGVARALQRVWLYAVIGGLGSAALLLIFPLVVLVVCCLSLVAAATAIFWVPPLAFFMHVNNMLIYDFDCPRPGKLNR